MFISTVAGYVLFGTLCVVDPRNQPWGERCLNFWEDPIVKYETLDKCKKAANDKAKQIKQMNDENNIPTLSLEISCFHTDAGKGKNVDFSLKMQYNIL